VDEQFVIPAEHYGIDLSANMEIDFREDDGKWVKAKASLKGNIHAQITTISGKKFQINLIKDRDRIACSKSFSEKRIDEHFFPAFCGQWVTVWAAFPEDSRQWVQGEIIEVDDSQALIKYENVGKEYKNWVPLNRSWDCFEIFSFEEAETRKDFSITKEIEFNALFNLQIGTIIRVLDERGFWCMAQVQKYDSLGGVKIRIHYERWNSKFEEWICLNQSLFRVLSLSEVENNPAKYLTEEIAIQFQADLDFKRKMNEKNLDIISLPSDGNCLYSSFSHQIYGDPSKHEEIRNMCCHYMVRSTCNLYFLIF
jgi:hypothetical protein